VVSDDPVLQRRARVARLVQIGQRVGYGFLLLAIVAFGVGAATSFPAYTVTASITGLVAASVILPVPIVLGYGVRAAERDERRAAGGLPPSRH
jgi:hypothetical protein